jgi:2-amino-4-hydroxy-6-hydroxymethyldihydropteridine diphosphokinase
MSEAAAIGAWPLPAPPRTVYLGLGGNQGDRLAHLRGAAFALWAHPETEITGTSRLYETRYVGPGRQRPYLNACLELQTSLPPRVLLAVLKAIEARHGRRPDGHLRPRPLDLDLLLYGDLGLSEPGLILPHPRLEERAFVLEPLHDLAPHLILPGTSATVAAACARMRAAAGPWVRVRPEGRRWWAAPAEEEDELAAVAVHRP